MSLWIPVLSKSYPPSVSMCGMEGSHSKADKAALSQEVHDKSLQCNENGGETANELMRRIISHFGCLLPDHGHGQHLEEDVKRVAMSLGPSFSIHLSSLLPLLIHTLDNPQGCSGSIIDQKNLARSLIEFVTINYGDSLAPLSLHLETLVMRQIIEYERDVEWATQYIPTLLNCLKNHGGSRHSQLWHDYWNAVKEEMGEVRREEFGHLIPVFLSSVARCLERIDKKDVTVKEMEEMATAMKNELGRLSETSSKDHSRKSSLTSESEVSDLGKERGSIISSCTDLIYVGTKILGASFSDIVRPLLPILCPLVDRSWEWDMDIKDDFPAFTQKLRDKMLLLLLLEKTCDSSQSTTSHTTDMSDVKDQIKHEITIDYDGFYEMMKNLKSEEYEKKQAAEDTFDAVKPTLKILYLWRIVKDSGKDKELALELLAQIDLRTGIDWADNSLSSFCEELLKALDSEPKAKYRSMIAKVAAHIGSARTHWIDDRTMEQTWNGLIIFMEQSKSAHRLVTSLQIIEHCPGILGSSSLLRLYEQSIDHSNETLRKASIKSFSKMLAEHGTNDASIKLYLPIVSSLIKKVQKMRTGALGGCSIILSAFFTYLFNRNEDDTRWDEKKASLDCILSLVQHPLDVYIPLTNEIFALGTKLLSHTDNDVSQTAYRILEWIVGNGWKKVNDLVGETAMNQMCEEMLKCISHLSSPSDCDFLASAIGQIATSKYEDGTCWKDLHRSLDESISSNCFLRRLFAYMTIKASPVIFLQDEDFSRRIIVFIEKDCRDQEGFSPMQFSALDAFVAVVMTCDEEGDERMASILASTTSSLVEAAGASVLSKSSPHVLTWLLQLFETKILRAHLPRLLEMCKEKIVADGGRDRNSLKWRLRPIRRQIKHNAIDIRSTASADKSAFVPIDCDADSDANNELFVDTDDVCFGMK